MTKSKSIVIILRHRGVAQLGSAFGSGPKGRKFKSCHLDQQAKLGLFRAKKTPIISAIFFTLFCLRFASVHRQDSPKCVTLAKCSLFRSYAPYKSCHGGKTLPFVIENAMCVFLLYGRFFLFRKKSRKLNFLRVAHFVRNNKDINETKSYFRLFILYIRNSLYLKKIVIIVF